MKRRTSGFTLTEILLVSAMFALISLAVFNAFANGFKLWARGEHVMVEGNIAMFLDRIAEDVRQTVIISGIPFHGGTAEFSFPAIVWGATDDMGARAKEETGAQIGAIRYVFEPDEKKIFRYQANYAQALKEQWPPPVEVADLVENISLRYYYKADKGLQIKTEADYQDGLPLGIMIDVEYLVEAQGYHMRRFLIMPVGGGI